MTAFMDVDWSRLPAPEDDGAAAHLKGMRWPALALPSTQGGAVDVSRLPGRTLVYIYPMTGRPGVPLPDGWDMIPGARGCTPQSCAFRDHAAELAALGVGRIFGLSTQDTVWQREAAERLHLPFAILSDERLVLMEALRLPWFEAEGKRLLKRMSLMIDDGVITDVVYPVFPPDQNARLVIERLKAERPR